MPTKKPIAPGLTSRELGAEIGVSRDTIRVWVDRGLLPPVEFRGPATHYGASHQLRAKVIAKLRAEGLSYDDIARRIAVPDAQLAGQHGLAPAAEPPPSPARPAAPTWQRVELLPGLELHVASAASAFVQRIADEVVARYRASASETPPA